MLERTLRPSPITPTVDFSAEGVQHGFLRLPYSRDDSAWGSVMIPVTVVKNGEGPTALLTGGNHGDEYEGPIALFDLARTLKAEDVKGRVIIVPAMNYPAFLAGTRTSPIDKGNLNRSFPGAPDGTVTQNKAQEAKAFDLVLAFGAPWSMKMLEIDAVGMYDTAAEDMGKIFITTELGGGGTATAKSAGIAKTGVRNVLKAAGILKGSVETAETTWLDMPDGDCFSFAEDGGLIEPLYDLGDMVTAGDTVARIYPVGRTGAAPLEVKAKMDGILAARHFPGLVKPGDCVSVLAAVVP